MPRKGRSNEEIVHARTKSKAARKSPRCADGWASASRRLPLDPCVVMDSLRLALGLSRRLAPVFGSLLEWLCGRSSSTSIAPDRA